MKKILFILPVIALLLCSCGKKATYLKTENDKVTFAKQGGDERVTVDCDGTFDIEGVPEWLKVEKENGEEGVDKVVLVFSAGENTTGAKREATITLTGSDTEAQITVTQVDKCTYIKTSETEVTIPKEGGDVTLDVETDGGNLKAEATEGITAEYSGGKLKVSAPANEGGAIDGTVTLSCDNITTEVKVTVEGNICQTCNGTGKVKCSKCGGSGEIMYREAGDLEGCSACGGSGSMNVLRMHDYGFRKGSGRMTCPTCHGSGH